MELEEIIARIDALESRVTELEARPLISPPPKKAHRRERTPEEKAEKVRQLREGKERKKREREAAEAVAGAEKPAEVSSGDDPSGARQKRPRRASE